MISSLLALGWLPEGDRADKGAVARAEASLLRATRSGHASLLRATVKFRALTARA